ncbi:3-dehydroquinate synthase [Kordiimonas lacus]|uniref:3-dehydroquinate synthase n=1 Tax=Kordiimonas lacus TaxID=637679 RepID=A0A1G6UL86_9PROT|nr:3-dehydroquinate synthase [Kordiimonas lacus]SDD42190.1 3-dehydroquinate synthase [Kordiimonas lacus]
MSTATGILKTVPVDLGDRAYDIQIGVGIMAQMGTLVGPILKQKHAIIITDENVAKLHLAAAEKSLANAGIKSDAIILPAGEATKSFANFEKLTNQLLELGAERKDTLLALGGGVIGDITGFAAAVLRRGMDFIQVPTSLLAQVDSSVGGKTGINTPFGKNLVGAFHQPKMVVIDLQVLDTLPARELQAGYAEVVKYGLIDDPDFFSWLEENGARLRTGDREAQAYAVAKSCEAKARIVAEDEYEAGKRALLNLGHTFGHALEAECGYDGTLLHGEGVAIGMAMALDTSVRMGLAPKDDLTRYLAHLKSVNMMATASQIGKSLDVDTLLAHMSQDKKVDAGEIVFILGPIGGAATHKGVDLDIIKAVIEDSIDGRGL